MARQKRPGKRAQAKAAWMERANARRIRDSVFFDLLTGERCVVDADIWDGVIVPADIAPRIAVSCNEVMLGRRTLGHAILEPRPERGMMMDHKNRNNLDCRRINLRWVTCSESNRNRIFRRVPRRTPRKVSASRYYRKATIEIPAKFAPAVINLLLERNVLKKRSTRGTLRSNGSVVLSSSCFGTTPEEANHQAEQRIAAMLQARKDVIG